MGKLISCERKRYFYGRTAEREHRDSFLDLSAAFSLRLEQSQLIVVSLPTFDEIRLPAPLAPDSAIWQTQSQRTGT